MAYGTLWCVDRPDAFGSHGYGSMKMQLDMMLVAEKTAIVRNICIATVMGKTVIKRKQEMTVGDYGDDTSAYGGECFGAGDDTSIYERRY